MSKKTKKIAIFTIIGVISVCLIMLLILNVDVQNVVDGACGNEIVPEEEISDAQLRETTVNLYYVGANNDLKPILKKIDSKRLIENPYLTTMQILLEKPTDSDICTCIPDNVRINKIEKKGECLVIDFSKEFLDNMEENVEKQGLCISQIVNTMTQFTEINAVKILVDGSDECSFKNGTVNFKQFFTNED